jgi:triosephosphate isomerase
MVGVSLKMYFDLQKTTSYIQSCLPLHILAASKNVEIFIIPDLLSLASASNLLLSAPSIRLGAPDCFWEDSGAYTGEVSPMGLKSLGVSMVELGHAERRRIFSETDEMVGKKAQAVERNGMTPLVCIGEKIQGTVEEAIEECKVQIQAVLQTTHREIILAYEPVWAIGQSESADAEYVVAVTKGLRKICIENERDVIILYGGSAAPGTFEPMREGVDGLFLGRFAHNVENFEQIIREIGI